MTDYDAYVGAAAGGIMGSMIIFVLLIDIVVMAFCILQIIGGWKILSKAGKPGWGAIIPIYSQYLLCQVAGVNPWWILIVFLSPIVAIIPVVGWLAFTAVVIYFKILINVSLARSFGKEDGFAVGLILLAPIFYFILGIKDDKYIGPHPMNDIIFKNNNQNTQLNQMNNNMQPNNNMNNQPINPQGDMTNNQMPSQESKFCPSCGTQVESNATFCPSCGKQL